ncbi:MAG: RidA family protein [Clostridiales bacterium]|jgi:2-iminobutanoate/2-iminopropanoate deaminase|nr:RidA family protein [Clostridiales bacterium]
MKIIYTQDAPSPIGPYSQGVLSGGVLYLSGQIPINPKTGDIVSGGIEAQTEAVIMNIGAVLRAAGLNFSNVVKTTCFLSSMDHFSTFNSIYEKYFISKPARSCVEAARLPQNVLVEIEVIAQA